MSQPAKEGVVNIHGKQYKTVALRVNEFHEACVEKEVVLALRTNLIHHDATKVIMKASIVDMDGNTLATGHAEEFRATSNINKTSAMENAETSAIGRALAAFGFAGTEFASANEVQGAITQQQKAAPEQIAAIEAYITNGLVKPEHLVQRFGHSDLNRLLLVEANRIINSINSKQSGE